MTPQEGPSSSTTLNGSSTVSPPSPSITNDAPLTNLEQPLESSRKPDAVDADSADFGVSTHLVLSTSSVTASKSPTPSSPTPTLPMQRSASLAVSSSSSPYGNNGYSGYYRPTPVGRPSQGHFDRLPGGPPPMNPNQLYYGSLANPPRPHYQASPRPTNYQQPPPPAPSSFYTRPPPPPPALQQQQRMMVAAPSYATTTSADNSYFPDSSVLAASQAGRRTPSSSFPPLTMDNLQKLRTEAQASNDPQKMLDLAKFMMEMVPVVTAANEKDPKRARKLRDTLTTEAQRIVKKLTTTTGSKSGYGEAHFFLADCYGSGKLGLTADADRAFSLYLQGSKQNHPACTYRVAVCYEVGAGTKKDNAHAIQFFRKAANLGDGRAMYKLSMILLRGTLGQAKNPREGMSWLERAAANADEDTPQAIHDLGVAFEKESIPSVIPDLNYARDLFTRAAQYGYAPSQFKLGLAYENGFLHCPIDPRRSIAWYSKAAEQGEFEAELALSGWYLTGATSTMDSNVVILLQNDVEAYLWARKAADRGYAKAEYAVGYYTETGVGVKQSLDEARRWYMRAAAQNNRRAMQRLAELKKHGNIQQRKKHTRDQTGRSNEKDSDCSIM